MSNGRQQIPAARNGHGRLGPTCKLSSPWSGEGTLHMTDRQPIDLSPNLPYVDLSAGPGASVT